MLERLDASFSEEQRAAIAGCGFLVEGKLPGAKADESVCHPPQLGPFTRWRSVQLDKLKPPMRWSRVEDVGVKALSFKLAQVPEDWAFDPMPEGSRLRLTAARGPNAGGALKMDLPRDFVAARRGPVGETGGEDRSVRQRVA